MVEAMREKRREDFERLEKRLIEIKEVSLNFILKF